MKKSKYSEEQIAYAVCQADGGAPVGDACRQLRVSEATFLRTYGTRNTSSSV